MITKITIKRFKRFDHISFDIHSPVLLIGPNNSGKTTALQALSLWELGLRKWKEKSSKSSIKSTRRTGASINRKDLINLPVPAANLLWKNLKVRKQQLKNGQKKTNNIMIEIIVEGLSNNKTWKCALEFDYNSSEAIYCRPLGIKKDAKKWDSIQKKPIR